MDMGSHHLGMHHQLGGLDVGGSFSPEDLEIAQDAFSLIVGDDPRRALRLDTVLRWRPGAWAEFDDKLRECGFDRKRPGHLAALQWLIDKAHEEDGKS